MSNNINPYISPGQSSLSQFEHAPDNSNSGTFDPYLHSFNLERMDMERGQMFNMDARHNRFIPAGAKGFRLPGENDVGEITGQNYQEAQMNQGMPMRQFLDVDRKMTLPNFDMNKYQENSNNPQLDFDLFRGESQMEVSYNDPMQAQEETQHKQSFASLDDQGYLLPKQDRVPSSHKLSGSCNLLTETIHTKVTNAMKTRSCVSSPFSLLIPFIVLYRGSNGATEQELKRCLYLLDKRETFKALNEIMINIVSCPSIQISNYIFASKKFPIKQTFSEFVSTCVNITRIDTQRPKVVIAKINSLVNQRTNGLIKNLLRPGFITPDTAMVLVSTIFFKGQWKYPFDKSRTKKEIFYSTRKRTVPMMFLSGKSFRYCEDEHNQVLEMDYHDGRTCFGILLPKTTMLPHTDGYTIQNYVANLENKEMGTIKIPKFKIESRFKAVNTFKKLGLYHCFTDAQLDEITPSKEKLFISDIIHQAIIMVDETGTEAATASAMSTFNASDTKGIDFIANHPFTFYIRYKMSNTVLFIGNYI